MTQGSEEKSQRKLETILNWVKTTLNNISVCGMKLKQELEENVYH